MTHTPCFCSVRQAGAVCLLPHQQQEDGLRRFRQLGAAVQCLRIRRVGLQDDQRRAPDRSNAAPASSSPDICLKLHVRLRRCER